MTVDGARVVYRVGADMVLGARKERKKRAKADALARRRELMDAWARHCERTAGENVLTFKRPA